MSASTLVLYDPAMLSHQCGPGHIEQPGRLGAIAEELTARPVPGTLLQAPRPAPRGALERVHAGSYLDLLDSHEGSHASLDPDTGMSPGSHLAMRLAAGAGLDAVCAVHGGAHRNAFCAVRPPGHHAEWGQARGFCLVNNIAVAAAHLTSELGYERVLVVDWDIHHGNGTQHTFEERADVLFFSSHRYPFYPGTGDFDEIGAGPGVGHTINVPLPYGCGDDELIAVYEQLLVPAAERYQPQFVLLSAGYDAHRDDPLGGFRMTDEGFARLATLVTDIAERHAEGRLVAFLEGGYDLRALARSVRLTLEVMTGRRRSSLAAEPHPSFSRLLDHVRGFHGARWGL